MNDNKKREYGKRYGPEGLLVHACAPDDWSCVLARSAHAIYTAMRVLNHGPDLLLG